MCVYATAVKNLARLNTKITICFPHFKAPCMCAAAAHMVTDAAAAVLRPIDHSRMMQQRHASMYAVITQTRHMMHVLFTPFIIYCLLCLIGGTLLKAHNNSEEEPQTNADKKQT